jgi:hypothetical protein
MENQALHDSESQAKAIIIVNIIFPVLSTIVATIRCYTRFNLTKSFAIEDAFAILALVCSRRGYFEFVKTE